MHVRIYKRHKYVHVHGHHMQPNNKLIRISHAHFAQQRTTANAFARLMCSALIFHKCVKHNTIVSVDSLRCLSPFISLYLSVSFFLFLLSRLSPLLLLITFYFVNTRSVYTILYEVIQVHFTRAHTLACNSNSLWEEFK